jgi:hypothetical protein
MTRTTIFARVSAAAAAAALLAGLAAMPAAARVDPGEPASQQVQQNDGDNKAQIEHDEQQSLVDGRNKAQIEHDEQQSLVDGRNKAQIEHDEQVSVPPASGNDGTASSNQFPWALASLAAAGLAALAAGGVMVLRHRRHALTNVRVKPAI